MVNNIPSFRSSPREDSANRSDRTKPRDSGRDDRFRKAVDERHPKKDEEEYAASVEEHEDPGSLFDLSRKTKVKKQSSLTGQSSLKETSSGSELSHNRPLTAKEGSKDQSQDQGSNLFSQGEASVGGNDLAAELFLEDLYAITEAPVGEGGLQKKEANPSPLSPEPVKKPMERFTPTQETDALKQQEIASDVLSRPQKVKRKNEESFFETDNIDQTSKKQKTSKSEEPKSEGKAEIKENPSIIGNISAQSMNLQLEKAPETQETARPATIQELATQIIDHIQIMRKDNQTQTTLTLRHPPILEGATITLTTSDHAKREFNIAFANLSPDAKLLLDRKFTEDSLTETLERKGIIVHMLTTSTQAETLLTVDAGQASRDRQDQQQQQQQQQKRQNFQAEEEEEKNS